jgi:hypothetical protein
VRDVLTRKFESFEATIKPWRETLLGGKEFPRHASQTRAVVMLLDGLRGRIDADLKPVDPPREQTLTHAAIENRILTAYQLWNVYRLKFDQRLAPELERFLRAADELAWLCYEPARQAAYGPADARGKEPPLVYLSSEASPMIDARHKRVQSDGLPRQLVEAYGWPEAAMRLPFALVGLPWYQTGFLPGALAIAHEIGHAVEDDFGLSDQLEQLIEAALGKAGPRTSTWMRWQNEMFADLWGALCLGPAYGRMLSDFIAPKHLDDPAINLTGEYPPDALRVYWTSAVIARIASREFQAQAAELWERWRQLGPVEVAPEFFGEADRIADAWLGATYEKLGGRRLESIMSFDSKQELDARDQADTALKGRASAHGDVRVLWAAVQHAFTKPATDVLLGRILAAASRVKRKAQDAADQQARDHQVKTSGGLLI